TPTTTPTTASVAEDGGHLGQPIRTNLPTKKAKRDVVAGSLHAKIVAKGKQYFGTCADAGLIANAQNAQILKDEFGQLTPENSMKWDSLEPSKGTFNFANADKLVAFAQENNKLVRGHTLVWHSQLPGWVNNVNDKASLTAVIENHVTTIVTHFKGKLFHWDVVNEIFNEDGTLRQSVFSRVLGDEFVSIAFRAAKAADPDVKLYINDYNLDGANAKVTGMVNLVKKMKAAGVPIDGIGTQTHLNANQGGTTAAALAALAGAGAVEVAITEMDVSGGGAGVYETVTKACLAQKACVGITVWGVSDKDSWRANTSPLLFDTGYNKKAAYNAVSKATSTTTTTTTAPQDASTTAPNNAQSISTIP
ncbi:family 10 glycosyl hydrolase, partial [Peziza echinospora]